MASVESVELHESCERGASLQKSETEALQAIEEVDGADAAFWTFSLRRVIQEPQPVAGQKLQARSTNSCLPTIHKHHPLFT